MDGRRCDKSPTGWHEFVVDTCCHCGHVMNTPIEEEK